MRRCSAGVGLQGQSGSVAPVTPVRSAQKIVDVLSAQGVQYIFGVPGAKIDAVYDALVDGGPQLVVCRHEQNAAFMAAAVGRLTGIPGVVLVTSGPGTTNLATGLLTANTEQDPVVALCGAVRREDRLKRTHQSMDAAAVLRTVTKFTGEINHPDNAAEATVAAFRAALTEPRGAAAVVLPADVLAAPTTAGIAARMPGGIFPVAQTLRHIAGRGTEHVGEDKRLGRLDALEHFSCLRFDFLDGHVRRDVQRLEHARAIRKGVLSHRLER